jgi:NTE family protein
VLKALEELSLKPDLVVGASAGALVGVLWASGCPAQEIENLALSLNPLNLARVAFGASERFSGSAVAALVQENSRHQLLERLPLPAVCVAHRRSGNAGVVGFSRGDAGLAVQAACAIEGQLAPLVIRGQTYVDADLHMPLPVRLARDLGAQLVLAVDASAHENRAPPAAERWRDGDLRKRALTQPDAQAADLLLHPDFGYFVSFSREFRERCIASGYRETMSAAAALQRLHAA